MSDAVSRHLSPEGFAAYLRGTAPIELHVAGTPALRLFVHQRTRVGLRGPARLDEQAPPTGLEHLTVQVVHYNGQRMIEISVTDPLLFEDAYPVLCAVADRVQIDGRSVTEALTRTLHQLGDLLQPEAELSRETEIGLLGELSMLAGAIQTSGPVSAVQSWRGWDREEHDFGLPECDVEVKTTTVERRAHRISSLTQLVPTPGRPLWLVSIQVTPAGSGGRTVSQLVERVRGLVTDDDRLRQLNQHLRAGGWRDRFQFTAVDTWRLRSATLPYRVDDTFPRITPALLHAAGISNDHITDASYRLDLTTLTPNKPPSELAATIAQAEKELP